MRVKPGDILRYELDAWLYDGAPGMGRIGLVPKRVDAPCQFLVVDIDHEFAILMKADGSYWHDWTSELEKKLGRLAQARIVVRECGG